MRLPGNDPQVVANPAGVCSGLLLSASDCAKHGGRHFRFRPCRKRGTTRQCDWNAPRRASMCGGAM